MEHATSLVSYLRSPVLKFLSCVQVASLIVLGGGEGRAPSKVKILANRDDLDFTKCAVTVEGLCLRQST